MTTQGRQNGNKRRVAVGDKLRGADKVRTIPVTNEPVIQRKPEWIRVRVPANGEIQRIKKLLRRQKLHTVCEEAACPNLPECFGGGTATFMIMGHKCTRRCPFCDVAHGSPDPLDPNEPAHLAHAVGTLSLKYVVITSVDRDDLADGGAAHYAACIRAIKARNPQTAVEALTPDFSGSEAAVAEVVTAGLDVFAQNLETVRRLTHPVRDPRAGYQQTLDVLAMGKRIAPEILTKSSLMLGLGETDDEIHAAMDDLRAHDVDVLTLGQYLRPTVNHLPVHRWVRPEEFEAYREAGLARGFREVAAGPLVRSSYRADRILEGDNLGLIPVRSL